MSCHICTTCGTQYAETPQPPPSCAICTDERQYVGWAGQGWTTHEQLSGEHAVRVGLDDGVLALVIQPEFGIGQRALLASSPTANVLWECLSIVSDEAVDVLKSAGGVDAIAISHPHFYTSCVEWSEALGGVPILVHAADRDWVQRPSPHIQFWSGSSFSVSEDVTLVNLPGHFPGSSVLHWKHGPHERPALLTGDSIHVASDRRHVSVMYSYPNHIPVGPGVVERIRDTLSGYEFDDAYGFNWGRNIIGTARAAVDASFARYLDAVGGSAGTPVSASA